MGYWARIIYTLLLLLTPHFHWASSDWDEMRCPSTKVSLFNHSRMLEQNKRGNIKYWPIQKISPGHEGPEQESEERKGNHMLIWITLTIFFTSDLWNILNSFVAKNIWTCSIHCFQSLFHTQKLTAFHAATCCSRESTGGHVICSVWGTWCQRRRDQTQRKRRQSCVACAFSQGFLAMRLIFLLLIVWFILVSGV